MTARYRFGLATVARVRDIEEQRAATELRRRQDEALQAAASWRDALRLRAEVDAPPPPIETVAAVLARRQVIEWRQAAAISAHATATQAESDVVGAAAAHRSARMKVVALERLEERQRGEYEAEVDRREQRTLDQVANDRRERRPRP